MARRIAVIGKSGRLHAIIQAFMGSASKLEIFALSDVNNPGLAADAIVTVGASDKLEEVEAFLKATHPELVIIGPEEPLEAGVADLLARLGIPCVGPLKTLARLESSKSFTRSLMTEYGIPGNVEYRIFHDETGLPEYLKSLGEFVVKPDGLTGGKGVKVFGEHLSSLADALNYCREILANKMCVVVEEKLDGEEFSFQSFFDGWTAAHTFPIQDHKRAREGDAGPNTGGMGSYSCSDHLLPFLTEAHIREAGMINQLVGEALFKKTGERYKGILYGGFMLTRKGLKVIEYNARFGDPEAMNVLPLLETDFVDVCDAIINGSLNELEVRFKKQATVCKYIVPEEYPGKFTSNATVDVTRLEQMRKSQSALKVYYGAIQGDDYRLTGSRAIAVLGMGDTLAEAEAVAERAAQSVTGRVYHRSDIGTAALVQKRIDHMNRISGSPKSSSRGDQRKRSEASATTELARRIG